MLIVIARARALPECMDDLVVAAGDMVASTRTDEGCKSYGFFADITDPAMVVSLEVWDDRAALDAHMTHQHTHEFLSRITALVEGAPSITVHEVLGVG